MVTTGYRIGEIADETGFPPSTLRYYEEEGLLPAPDRTPAGHRIYDVSHLERLRFMARAKRLGLTLEEIADLADAWDNRECTITHGQLVALLEAKLAQAHDEIVEITRFADQLQAVFERVTGERPDPAAVALTAAARRRSPMSPRRLSVASVTCPSTRPPREPTVVGNSRWVGCRRDP